MDSFAHRVPHQREAEAGSPSTGQPAQLAQGAGQAQLGTPAWWCGRHGAQARHLPSQPPRGSQVVWPWGGGREAGRKGGKEGVLGPAASGAGPRDCPPHHQASRAGRALGAALGPSLVWPRRVGSQDCHPRTKVVRAVGGRGVFGRRPVLSLGALCSPFNQPCTRGTDGSVSGAG